MLCLHRGYINDGARNLRVSDDVQRAFGRNKKVRKCMIKDGLGKEIDFRNYHYTPAETCSFITSLCDKIQERQVRGIDDAKIDDYEFGLIIRLASEHRPLVPNMGT